MTIPFKLPSFHSCKQVVVWANCMLDPVAYLLICDVLCIPYIEESSVASHLHCLYSALKVGGECPGFACIQEDRLKLFTSSRVFPANLDVRGHAVVIVRYMSCLFSTYFHSIVFRCSF